jgi:hypothetical protein
MKWGEVLEKGLIFIVFLIVAALFLWYAVNHVYALIGGGS